jgi:hypothetical protein
LGAFRGGVAPERHIGHAERLLPLPQRWGSRQAAQLGDQLFVHRMRDVLRRLRCAVTTISIFSTLIGRWRSPSAGYLRLDDRIQGGRAQRGRAAGTGS